MKKFYVTIGIMLVLAASLVYGCTSPTFTRTVTTLFTMSTTTQTWPSASNQVINSASWELIPSDGAYVQAGKTLSLSWSADGSLKCYICSANQYNNFKNSNGVTITYFQKGEGSQGSISFTIQNTDTYYAVLYNDALGFLGVGPTVELYQATLMAR